jgi:hypothetical protein
LHDIGTGATPDIQSVDRLRIGGGNRQGNHGRGHQSAPQRHYVFSSIGCASGIAERFREVKISYMLAG